MQQQANQDDNLISIPDVMPTEALPEDPITDDVSHARGAIPVSNWRFHRLEGDELIGITEPGGRDRRSRKARRAHAASREARMGRNRKARGRARVVVACAFVILAICLVYAGVTYSLEIWGGKAVPNVVGVSQAKATELLEQKGFLVNIEEVPADIPEGHVVSVEPQMGERIAEGSTVYLTIARSRTVPDVEGMSRDEAVEALKNAGATNFRFEWQDELEDRDIVLEVRPEAGTEFMSSDEIVLVISQKPTVPEGIVGMTENEAREKLSHEGYPVDYRYEQAGSDERLKVIGISPEEGESIDEDGVTVTVGDPLVDVRHIADYFDAKAPHIDDFLHEEGFDRVYASKSEDNHIAVKYRNEARDVVAFVSDPWSTTNIEGDQNDDVMVDGAPIEGVRLRALYAKSVTRTRTVAKEPTQDQEQQQSQKSTNTSESEEGDTQDVTSTPKPTTTTQTYTTEARSSNVFDLSNPTIGQVTAEEVMDQCGLYNEKRHCTQSDITLPKGTNRGGQNFYCCYGEEGNYVWTVLVKATTTDQGADAVEIVATMAPKTAYAVIDLSTFGDNICDFVAYWDVYAG